MAGGGPLNIPGQEVDRHNREQVSSRGAYVLAAWVVDRPAAVHVREVLAARLNWRKDRQMTLRTLLIGLLMIGPLDKRSHHRQIRLALRSLPLATQRELGVINRRGRAISYRMIEKAINQIADVLAEPSVLVGHNHPVESEHADEDAAQLCGVDCPFMVAGPTWFATAMSMAAMPPGIPMARDLALDWTDMPTWAKQRFRFEADLETAAGDDDPDYHAAAIERAASRAKVFTSEAPIGPDGRKVLTKDSDARVGHRSARSGVDEFFVGFDLHTALGTAARNGAKFAPFIFGAVVRPAGSYAGDAAVELLRTLRYFGATVRDLNADRGYTRLDYDRFGRPILQIADNIVLDLTENQRRRKADWTVVRGKGTTDERTIRILRIAGSFFCSALPKGLYDLSRPARNADSATRLANMAEFDDRAQYAFVRHGCTDAGTPRWTGPATAKAGFKIRCPNNPDSLRGPENGVDKRPLTTCTKAKGCSCGAVVAIDDPSTERERQSEIWATTKWTGSFNRRTVVERGFGDDKFQITSLDRKSICCFGTIKHVIYYVPIAVARNLQVALRWYHDTGQVDPWSIAEVSRPDYRFPEELNADIAGTTKAEVLVESSTVEPSVDAGTDGEEQVDPADVPARPTGNREQRRWAERATRKPASSKPPKPPPRGDSNRGRRR